MPTRPSKSLETFPNPEPGRDYIIEIETPEFTCLCPKTGQPDFATLTIEYVPDRLCVELKSLKLYVWSYRNEGHFHEQVTNTILNDLVAAVQPRWMQVRAAFYVRGGIYTTVTAEHRRPGWEPPPPPPAGLPREHQSARDADLRETRGGPAAPTRAPASSAPPRRAGRAGAGAIREPAPAAPAHEAFIGIDLGARTCRVMAVDSQGKVLALAETALEAPEGDGEQLTQDPNNWWQAALGALKGVLGQIDPTRVRRLGVAGPAGALLLCDAKGAPVGRALLADDRRAAAEADRVADVARDSAARAPHSSLAKLLWLQRHKRLAGAAHALHPADWLTGRLTGVYGRSDAHNGTALGYDTAAGGWADWLRALGVPRALLPEVHAPGEVLGPINPAVASALGLPAATEVVAGTTNNVAALLASGAGAPGHGVTALGSHLAVQLVCEAPVSSAAHGVYSLPLGRYWLAGGRSNSGGHVLRRYFTLEQMREMTPLLEPDRPTDLDYYPLIDVGEQFPVNDPRLEPQLEPLPGDSVVFFQGILESIARIEAQAYAVLAELGAPAVSTVWTTGEGSLNPAWTRIRARALGVPLKAARSQQPVYGVAQLAAGALQQFA